MALLLQSLNCIGNKNLALSIASTSARADLRINDAIAKRARAGKARASFHLSTVLAQDHFYSDFLSLSLTILTHKGSMMMIDVCCGAEMCLGVRHRWDE